MIILCVFWSPGCLILQMSLVFEPIIESEKGLIFPRLYGEPRHKTKVHLSALRASRMSEFGSGNLKRVYLCLLSSGVILSDDQ